MRQCESRDAESCVWSTEGRCGCHSCRVMAGVHQAGPPSGERVPRGGAVPEAEAPSVTRRWKSRAGLGSTSWALTSLGSPEGWPGPSCLWTPDLGPPAPGQHCSRGWVFISCPRAPDVPGSSLLVPQVSARMPPPQGPLPGSLKVGGTFLGDHHPGPRSVVDKPRGQGEERFPTLSPVPSTWQGSGSRG